MDTAQPPHRTTGWLLAFLLIILAPPCAEYIIAYDDNTGDAGALLGGLLIFGPLYGAPALLIREMARRFGVGWSGILALATAFGIIQAGVIDQSLFSESYRQIDYWEDLIRPTWIGPLGFSANTAMCFIMGHAIWSFGIPIALVESLSPPFSDRPWLRRPGLVVTTLLYLGAAALVLFDHLENERDHASTAQVAGSLAVAGLLAIAAFMVGRRQPSTRDAAVPSPLVVGMASLLAGLAFNCAPSSWLGVAAGVAVLAACAIAVARFSRSVYWGGRHVVALATGALLSRAILGFLAEPLGDVPPLAKYSHNIVFLLGTILLGAWAWSRNKPSSDSELQTGEQPTATPS